MKLSDEYAVIRLNTDKNTTDFEHLAKGYLVENPGEGLSAMIHNNSTIKYIAFFELQPNQSRGGHWHDDRDESVCVLAGEIEVELALADSNEVKKFAVNAGEILMINKSVAHRYTTSDGAAILEYSTKPYRFGDTHRYDFDSMGINLAPDELLTDTELVNQPPTEDKSNVDNQELTQMTPDIATES